MECMLVLYNFSCLGRMALRLLLMLPCMQPASQEVGCVYMVLKRACI